MFIPLQATPNLEVLASLGLGAVITIALVAIVAQVGLSYLAQRNLNDQLSLGVQAIVGANNLQVIDNQQDDGNDGNSGQ